MMYLPLLMTWPEVGNTNTFVRLPAVQAVVCFEGGMFFCELFLFRQ